MAAPPDGPCAPWCDAADVLACDPDTLPAGVTEADAELAAEYATQVLYLYAGQQYAGECEETLQVCVDCSNCGDSGFLYYGVWPQSWPTWPVRIDGAWQNLGCGGDACWIPEVRLPGPVISVTEVLIDGAVLDPSAYEVAGWRRLIRIDGQNWPVGDPSNFEVTWVRGRPVTDVASKMATLLARKRLPFLMCDFACQIPDGATVVTQDGTTMQIASYELHQENAGAGKTGIFVVDEWLSAINPYRRVRRARVGRSDSPNHRRLTGA